MGCGRRDYPHESKLKKEPKCGGNTLKFKKELKRKRCGRRDYPHESKLKKEPHEFSVNSG
jgi:hypothetical protein